MERTLCMSDKNKEHISVSKSGFFSRAGARSLARALRGMVEPHENGQSRSEQMWFAPLRCLCAVCHIDIHRSHDLLHLLRSMPFSAVIRRRHCYANRICRTAPRSYCNSSSQRVKRNCRSNNSPDTDPQCPRAPTFAPRRHRADVRALSRTCKCVNIQKMAPFRPIKASTAAKGERVLFVNRWQGKPRALTDRKSNLFQQHYFSAAVQLVYRKIIIPIILLFILAS